MNVILLGPCFQSKDKDTVFNRGLSSRILDGSIEFHWLTCVSSQDVAIFAQ